MKKGAAYAALSSELSRCAQLPPHELAALVDRPARRFEVTVEGEVIIIEVAANWADDAMSSVLLEASALGPSTWRMDQVRESTVAVLRPSRSVFASFSDKHVEGLLDELCVKLGYCLAPDVKSTIIASPPETVDAFVDAVLSAEGLSPELDHAQRRDVRAIVEKAIAQTECRVSKRL